MMPAQYAPSGNIFLDPLYNLWAGIVNVIPGLIAALIIILVGYFIGLILGHFVKAILTKLRVDEKLKKSKVNKSYGHTNIAGITGEVVKWFIFLIFLQQGVSLLSLGALSNLLNTLVLWIPNLIAAGLVVIFGLWITHFIEHKVVEHTQMKGMWVLSKIIKVVVLIMIIVVALKQIGLKVSIIENTFLLIIGAFAVGLALALGIGLGLGMKGAGQNFLKQLKKGL